MIAEFLSTILTRADRGFRRLGYVHEQVAIAARYRRHKAAWQQHLTHTQGIICQAITDCPQRRQVVVLGSGLLLDIPMAELLEGFDQIILVDAVHPRRIRRRFKHHQQVLLDERDLSGVAASLLELPPDANSLPEVVSTLEGLLDADLLISANLLSQLPVAPMIYVQQHFLQFSEANVLRWGQEIISAHLKQLYQCKNSVCCISDQWHEEVDKEGHTLLREDRLLGIEVPKVKQQWRWQLAPLGEVSRNYTIEAEVKAFDLRG